MMKWLSSNYSEYPCRRRIFPFVLFIYFLYFIQPEVLSATDNNRLRITFLDVGYGDAIVIESPENETFLIDAGSPESGHKIYSFLRKHHIQALEAMILTHFHDNHYGGAVHLLDKIPIKQIYSNGFSNDEISYKSFENITRRKNIPQTILRRGDKISAISGIEMMVLHPDKLYDDQNANSIALWLIYKEFTLLMASDITPVVQKFLVDFFPEALASAVVQIPHHGSPLHKDFKTAIRESKLILSTGSNPYFEPLKTDSDLSGKNLFRTDHNGDITIFTDGKHFSINPAIKI